MKESKRTADYADSADQGDQGKLILGDKTSQIIGAAMEVHRLMGPGYLEAVYQECLRRECSLRGIPVVEHPRINLEYKGQRLEKVYVPDFLFFGEIIVEIKALARCTSVDTAQILNALRAASKPVGLLINFGERSLFWKRFANTKGMNPC